MRPLDPRLLRYARASRRFLATAAVLGVVRTGCTIAFCWLAAQVVTRAIAGASLAGLAGLLLWIVAVALVRAAAGWLMDGAAASGAARVKRQLRARLLAAVRSLGPSWLAGRNRAVLATTAGAGLEALDGYFSLFLPQLVLTAVAIPIIVVAMLAQDATSGIIVIATLPLIPVFMVLIGWATESIQRRQWASLTRLSSRFLDVVSGLATLKIFGREQRQTARLAAVTGEYRRQTIRVLRLSFLSGFALELIASLSVALVAVSIGLRLVNGSLGLAVGLFVLLLAPEAFLPLRQLGANYHAAADGVAAAGDVFDIIGLDVGATTPAAVRRADAPTGSVRDGADLRFSGVTVTIDGSDLVLDFGATAKSGQLTVLAGPSGSGKSTVIAALLGFAPFAGSIEADGSPVGRDSVAWAGQHAGLIEGTVADNVAIGVRAPDGALLARALDLAAADDIDPRMRIRADGTGLSGGQAERVAIARAVYRCLARDTPLLVLDEPSAGLDLDTELKLIENLHLIARSGRIVLVASHRPAFRAAADAIIAVREPARV